MISSGGMEQWHVEPEQGWGTRQVQGDPRFGTCTDNTVCTIIRIEGGDCKEVHGDGVLSTSNQIINITDMTGNANPKTTATTNQSLELSLTTSITHTSSTGQFKQHRARDGECGDGDDRLDDQHQPHVSEENITGLTNSNKIRLSLILGGSGENNPAGHRRGGVGGGNRKLT